MWTIGGQDVLDTAISESINVHSVLNLANFVSI